MQSVSKRGQTSKVVPQEQKVRAALEQPQLARRYLSLPEASARYGAHVATWRTWVRLGLLGDALVRLGGLVRIDSVVLDARLSATGQLLTRESRRFKNRRVPVLSNQSRRVRRGGVAALERRVAHPTRSRAAPVR